MKKTTPQDRSGLTGGDRTRIDLRRFQFSARAMTNLNPNY